MGRKELGVIEGLRAAVAAELWWTRRAVVATDGGAQGKGFGERVVAYGVAVGNKTWNGRVGGIDQTAYMAEMWALYKVVRSLEGFRGEILIIIDNFAVMSDAEKRRGVYEVECVLPRTPEQCATVHG